MLFYCYVFYPQESGYSYAFQNLVKAINFHYPNWQITIVTPYSLKGYKELNLSNVKIIRLKPILRTPKFIRYLVNEYFYAKQFIKEFFRENYDAVFIETFDKYWFLYNLPKEIFSKLAIRIHATMETEYTVFRSTLDDRLRKFFISKFIVNKILWFIGTNNYHIKFFKKFYFKENVMNIANKFFYILPNTLDPLLEKFLLQEMNLQNTTTILKNKLKLTIVGRLDSTGFNQKGFLDFILAFYSLPIKVKNKFKITIIGNGEKYDFLKRVISNLKLEINLIKNVSHNELITFLINSDIVVLPSRYEGMSMFALESLATGNICVFSKTGGLIELVENSKNGFLFESQNIDDLMQKLKIIANMNKEDLKEMKKKSISLYFQKFSSFKIANKFQQLIDFIIAYNKALKNYT